MPKTVTPSTDRIVRALDAARNQIDVARRKYESGEHEDALSFLGDAEIHIGIAKEGLEEKIADT